MKKKYVAFVLGLCFLLGGCGGAKQGKPIEVDDKVVQKAAVEREIDVAPGVERADESGVVESDETETVELEIEQPVMNGYVTSEPIYGIRTQVPAYLQYDEDEMLNHKELVYHCHDDGADVSYVSVDVSSDAWGTVELCDVGELTPDKAVYEDPVVGDDDCRQSAHYFFTSDSNNFGSDNEFQVIVHVSGKDEASVNRELTAIMAGMDFSGFYFDNFAE